jgi:hypothetical protein
MRARCQAVLPRRLLREGGISKIRTKSQNVHLKNLSFLAKSKIGFFACFFAQT